MSYEAHRTNLSSQDFSVQSHSFVDGVDAIVNIEDCCVGSPNQMSSRLIYSVDNHIRSANKN